MEITLSVEAREEPSPVVVISVPLQRETSRPTARLSCQQRVADVVDPRRQKLETLIGRCAGVVSHDLAEHLAHLGEESLTST